MEKGKNCGRLPGKEGEFKNGDSETDGERKEATGDVVERVE